MCNEEFVIKHGLQDQAVEIVAISLKTDPAKTFTDRSLIGLSGYDMTDLAARDVIN